MLKQSNDLLFLAGILILNFSPVDLGKTDEQLLQVVDPPSFSPCNLDLVLKSQVGHGLIDQLGTNIKVRQKKMKLLKGLFRLFLMN